VVWPVAVVLTLAGCGGGPDAPAQVEIPQPILDNAEPALREVIERAQQAVRDDPQSAAAWGELGDRYRAHVWVIEAAACYERAEELDPENFLWPYLRAKCLRLDEPEVAAEGFARALQLDPEYAPAHLFYGHTLVNLGRFEEAGREFEAALELDPTSAGALLGLGQLAISEGRHEEAREHLERAKELDPSDGRVQLALAQALSALGETERAAELADSARQLDRSGITDPRAVHDVEPAGFWGLTKRGKDLLAVGRIEEAEKYLREAVHLNPDHDPSRLALGLTLMMKRELPEAELQLRRAVELRPTAAEAQAALGNLLLLVQGLESEEAFGHLQRAVELNPQDSDSIYRLGLVLAGRGRLDEAEAKFRDVLAAVPEHVEARFRLGLALTELGRSEEAYREFGSILEINTRALQRLEERVGPPDESGRRRVTEHDRRQFEGLVRSSADAHDAMGSLAAAQGENKLAIRHLAEAARIRPDFAEAHLHLGEALAADGQIQAAEFERRKALELRPGWPEATQALARLATPP
jgi:tetratricopeptide (TPR) repeat protein